ncbi:VOC family protein [Candidatus Bathyarchaeota archaeon]|nr:VOC family protein [Candidatus Bathyarchaeota archaeon]
MDEFELEGTLTLFYYDDLEKAFEFYSEVVGFEFVADFGYVKIFKVVDGALLGLVDGELGSHRTSPSKPVRLVVMIKDIDAWFRRIKDGGVETFEDAPFTGKRMRLKGFTFLDPEGYTVEMCQYLTPYGL